MTTYRIWIEVTEAGRPVGPDDNYAGHAGGEVTIEYAEDMAVALHQTLMAIATGMGVKGFPDLLKALVELGEEILTEQLAIDKRIMRG